MPDDEFTLLGLLVDHADVTFGVVHLQVCAHNVDLRKKRQDALICLVFDMLQSSVMSFVMYACGFNMHCRFSRQTVLSVNASFSVGSENFAQFIVGQFRGRRFVLKWFYIDLF